MLDLNHLEHNLFSDLFEAYTPAKFFAPTGIANYYSYSPTWILYGIIQFKFNVYAEVKYEIIAGT